MNKLKALTCFCAYNKSGNYTWGYTDNNGNDIFITGIKDVERKEIMSHFDRFTVCFRVSHESKTSKRFFEAINTTFKDEIANANKIIMNDIESGRPRYRHSFRLIRMFKRIDNLKDENVYNMRDLFINYVLILKDFIARK